MHCGFEDFTRMPVAVVVRAALCLYAGGAGRAVESQFFRVLEVRGEDKGETQCWLHV